MMKRTIDVAQVRLTWFANARSYRTTISTLESIFCFEETDILIEGYKR